MFFKNISVVRSQFWGKEVGNSALAGGFKAECSADWHGRKDLGCRAAPAAGATAAETSRPLPSVKTSSKFKKGIEIFKRNWSLVKSLRHKLKRGSH